MKVPAKVDAELQVTVFRTKFASLRNVCALRDTTQAETAALMSTNANRTLVMLVPLARMYQDLSNARALPKPSVTHMAGTVASHLTSALTTENATVNKLVS